ADPFEEASAVAAGQAVLSASPAADTTLSEAMRLAGAHPVGSHHLLLATLADSNSTAARVLAQLGVDLDQAKEALRGADVTGTSDEQPEDAGRRQMVIEVTDELVTIVAADPVLVKAGNEALRALGGEAPSGEAPGDKASSGKASSGKASPAATIRGRDLRGPEADSLAKAWQALSDTFEVIQRTAAARQATGDAPGDSAPGDDAPEGKKGSPGEPGEPGAATTG
ncbi:MAG: Clp protease N-terminal domain-containing protein, partial [Nocardiopsaceae bacterium]|nr:Clp protease N-terminal domain-containing protein [Nocardiopsaceae bacterium]